MKSHWILLPDLCYQTYAKGWLIPCTSVISTNLQGKIFFRTCDSSPTLHTTDIMWQATEAFDKGILPKACSSFSLPEDVLLSSAAAAHFSANLPLLWGIQAWCLWGSILGPQRQNIHQFHPGKHYFLLDLGRFDWFARESAVLCLKMAQKCWGFHAIIWQSIVTDKASETMGR